MLRSYETVLIFTPVLTDDEMKQVIGKYRKLLQTHSTEVVHEDFWGLKQLAYPIKKKTTGVYLVVEYKATTDAVAKVELQFKRDENILRFMTIKLDKFAVEYNEKKRNGLIGRNRKKQAEGEA